MATMTLRVTRISTLAVIAAVTASLAACASGDGGGAAAPSVGGDVSGSLNILVSSATGSDAGFQAVNKAFQAAHARAFR